MDTVDLEHGFRAVLTMKTHTTFLHFVSGLGSRNTSTPSGASDADAPHSGEEPLEALLRTPQTALTPSSPCQPVVRGGKVEWLASTLLSRGTGAQMDGRVRGNG